jgi:peptidyl-prolyl cis-trans isomerase B (cyclophilin B)
MRGLAVLFTLAAVLVASGCGGTTPTSTTTAVQGSVTKTACSDVSKPKPRNPGTQKAPATRLDPSTLWTLTFRTSCGAFVMLLQPAASPRATASLVALARSGFFDGTIFHRIVPGFVIQGGDPTQRGDGGPGYTTSDTPRSGTRYVKGIVAMAKTATEPRGAAGSQFFVMTADAPSLPPDYAVVGHVISGMATVERIGKLGDPADSSGTPTQTVAIDRVTVDSR